MEEDIDNVKFLIGDLKASNYNLTFIKSLENLIAGYKNLEEKNKDLTWYFENQKENLIPKSKVKENIEELQKEYKKISKENFLNKSETQKVLNAQIVAYNELLEN